MPEMNWNRGEQLKDKAKTAWRNFKRQSYTDAHAADQFVTLINDIIADPDDQQEFRDAIEKGGETVANMQDRMAAAERVRDVILVDFPDALTIEEV